ncbi:MAG TPA: TOBE domain-containing protein, partial [Methylocystis sp.]
GRKALALIKASFVSLAPAGDTTPLQRNCFRGVVTQRIDAERNSEILLDVGFGKTMTVVTPRRDVEDMGLKEGDAALATFNASDVILAVE